MPQVQPERSHRNDIEQGDRPGTETDDDVAVDIVDIKEGMDGSCGEVQQVEDHEHSDNHPTPAHGA
jgi:hypothetical protein